MNKKIFVAEPMLTGNEKKYVSDCLDTTWISSKGKYVDEFEDAFAKFLGAKYAISCSNGTVALHVPLIDLGIKEGDEVIVPDLTYIATANAVRYCGATPIFADCKLDTWNIDPESIEKKITPRTRAILPVHIYGNPCDMDEIMDIARKHNLFVLEDAAECHGAEYKGKKAGTIGDVSCFSFFGNKIVTCGEGGMIVTNDDRMADHMRMIKGQGQDPHRRYWFTEVGYNYRMTNVAAAIGLAQVEQIEQHIEEHRKVASWYLEELEDARDYLSFQKVTEGSSTVWWMFSVMLNDKVTIERDEVMRKMEEFGIETRPVFYPMHVMPVYRDNNTNNSVCEKVASRGINLPTHGKLTREDVRFICNSLKNIIVSR